MVTSALNSERKKAMRKLKQAEKAHEQNPTTENEEQIDKYKLDLYYALHYPLTEKYIALYTKTPLENLQVLEKREQIRAQLREEMLYGKQNSSGSNAVRLGTRRPIVKDADEGMSNQEADGASGGSDEEDSEDEFLDLRHKER